MAMLITNGLVVTFDPDALHGRVIENGAVAIEGGAIVAVAGVAMLMLTGGEMARVLGWISRIVAH